MDIDEFVQVNLPRIRVCELGQIKIGGRGEKKPGKGGGEYRIPKKNDYFTITTMRRDSNDDPIPDTKLMEALAKDHADHDGKLRQLPIALMSDDLNDIMQTCYAWYAGKKLAATSDGREMLVYYDAKSDSFSKEPRVEKWNPDYLNLKDAYGGAKFKLHTVFNCVIAAAQSRWGGVYRFRTTSKISLGQLYSTLTNIKGLMAGMLRGLQLRLVLRPVLVNPKGDKAFPVYVVHCELIGDDLLRLQETAMKRAKFELTARREIARSQLEYRRLLRGPGIGESEAEAAEIAEEFHPEHQEPEPPSEVDPIAAELGLTGVKHEANGHKPAPDVVVVAPAAPAAPAPETKPVATPAKKPEQKPAKVQPAKQQPSKTEAPERITSEQLKQFGELSSMLLNSTIDEVLKAKGIAIITKATRQQAAEVLAELERLASGDAERQDQSDGAGEGDENGEYYQ